MDEEQQYYKEKYFKYKLKYLTLKEELEGGGIFSSKKTEPAKTAVTAVVAPAAAEKKVINPDDVITFLKGLLESKFTEKTIRRLPDQRGDTSNTYNYKIKKLIDEEMGKNKHDLSKLENIENMLAPVLKTANMKEWLISISDLKTYLRGKLKKKIFS